MDSLRKRQAVRSLDPYKGRLDLKHTTFLKEWGIEDKAQYLPPDGDQREIFIWLGRFVDGETVTIAADSLASRKLDSDACVLSVGVVREQDVLLVDEGINPLEVYAEAAVILAKGGLRAAIETLRTIKGLPRDT